MPSPVGHALGAFAAGWMIAGPPRQTPTDRGAAWRRALVFAAVGMAADLDLLIGRHSQFSHSLGAAVVVLAVATFMLRRHPQRLLMAVAVFAAYASHVLLDWLGQDATPPRGVMALWPVSHDYYLSHADIFLGISREPWRDGVVWHDAVAVVLEIAITGTLAAAAWWLRRRSTVQLVQPGSGANGQQMPSPREAAARGESSNCQ